MALARYQFSVVDHVGNVVPGASVEVRRESDNVLVSLYSDRAGLTAIGNPATSDVEGFVYFHVLGGAYKITATKGTFERVWRYVAIGTAAETDTGSADIGVASQHRPLERVVYEVATSETFVRSDYTFAWPPTTPFAFWAKAFDPYRDMHCAAILFAALPTSSVAAFEFRLYRRPRSAPSVSGPGLGASDQLLQSSIVSVTDAGVDPNLSLVQMARYAVDLPLSKDYTYIAGMAARAAGGAATNIGSSPGVELRTGLPSYSTGWFGFGGWNGSYGLIDPATCLSIVVMERGQEPAFEGPLPSGDVGQARADTSGILATRSHSRTITGALVTDPVPFQVRNDGLVAIPDTSIRRGSGTIDIPAQTVALSGIGTSTITDEAHTLVYGATFWLDYRYASSVVVKRHSNAAVLVEGTDYILCWEVGAIIGVQNVADFAVDVSYVAGYQRNDLIWVDPETGALGVTDGTDRKVDAVEYQPACPAGKLPLYRTCLFRIPSYNLIELIPVHQFRNYVRIGQEAEHWRWLDYCRARLPKTMRKLHRALPIRLACYGDSNTSMGGAVIDTRQTAGDLPAFFSGQRIPADTVALLPTFTEDANTKTPVNWPYFVKAAMEAQWGSAVTYANFGIPGSGSQSSAHNGSNSTRMSALIADAPDLVIIAFGMNFASYSTMATIIQAFQAAGIECLVMGSPAYNFYAGTQIANWRNKQLHLQLQEMLERVAKDNGCAYVNPSMLFALGNEGCSGIAQRDLAIANCLNHSGILERRVLGEYMALIFDGQVAATTSGAAGTSYEPTLRSGALPVSNDGAALGSTALQWSDLFLASGGVVNWNNGDVAITHSSNLLAFTGASSGYTFDAPVSAAGAVFLTSAGSTVAQLAVSGGNTFLDLVSGGSLFVRDGYSGSVIFELDAFHRPAAYASMIPHANDGAALGSTALQWSDLFLASGGVINWNNGDVAITHSSNLLAFTGASSGYTFDAGVTSIMAARTLKGNNTGSSGNSADLTATQLWTMLGWPQIMAGAAYDVDLNPGVATDTAITISSPCANYRIQAITVRNKGTTASLTAARAGVFQSVAAGGLALAADQALSALTGNAINTDASSLQMTQTVATRTPLNLTTIQFRVGTSQGAAASCDVFVYIVPLPQSNGA